MTHSIFQRFLAPLLGLTFVSVASGVKPPATTYKWSHFAGSTGGVGTAAQLNDPVGLAVDATGTTLYIADRGSNTVRKLSGNIVTVVAGIPNVAGNSDGALGTATLNFSAQTTLQGVGIALDGATGNLYVSDNHTVRQIAPNGTVTTLAGSAGQAGFNNANGAAARFSNPWGIVVNKTNVLVADYDNNCVRSITPAGDVSTFVGKAGSTGILDAPSTGALFNNPSSLSRDRFGQIYITDTHNHTVRVVDLIKNVHTVAGNGQVLTTGSSDGAGAAASFNDLVAVSFEPGGNGDAFVADPLNSKLRQMTIAGVVTSPTTGIVTEALATLPDRVTVYATAGSANLVRKVTTGTGGTVTPLVGNRTNTGSANGTGTAAAFTKPGGLAADTHGNVFIADTGNNTIRMSTSNGIVTTLAGDATKAAGSTNDTGALARFNAPSGLTVDASGTIYVADTGNHSIRAIAAGNVVTTFAGSGAAGSTDNTGTAAQFSSPSGVVISGGIVYVADTGNHTIRAITAGGVVSTLAGTAGSSGSVDNTGAVARFNKPSGIAVDSHGDLIVADTGNHTIRRVTTAGVTSTIAGVAGSPGSANGTGTAAKFNQPTGVTVDADDNIYVVDAGDDLVRKIDFGGVVTTIGGTPYVEGTRDGVGPLAVFTHPSGIVWSPVGLLYVADRDNNRLAVGEVSTPHLVVQRPDSTALVDGADTVAFGSSAVLSPVKYTLTLRNSSSSSSLTGISTTIDGTASSDFAVSTAPAATLASGASTTLTVTFTPSATGTRTAALHINSSDPDRPVFDIALSGEGIAGVSFQDALTYVDEAAGTVNIPVIRTGGTTGAVSVKVNSAPGTATAADYTPVVNFSLSFADGESTKFVPVTILPDLLNEPNESFTLTLSSPQNIVLGTPSTATIRIVDTNDSKKPTVTITAPAAAANLPEGTVTVTGTASDDKGVKKTQISLNGGPFADATTVISANGLTATYSATISPDPGPNTITVKSIDTRNNESVAVTRSFNSIWIRPLSVNVVGTGTLTKPFPGTDNTKHIGFPYTLVATPGAGQVFNGWTANSTVGTGITPASAELPSLTFTHQMGLVLTANFIANPFTPAIIGKFNGLILPDTQLPAPNGTATSNDTVGFLTATVTSTGSFSGQVKMAAQVFSISGVFDNTGLARFGTTRTTSLTLVPTSGLPWLEVVLHLDLTGTTSKITGTVTRKERSVITAVSNIDADRAFYSTTNKVSSALAGTTSKSYTLVFKHRSSQSGLTATEYPQGDGYATGTVKTDGTVSFTGMLADNTAVTLSAPLSKNDQWPLFTQLYSLKGAVVGMVKVQSASTTDMDSSAGLLWLRPYQSVQWYPFGWPDSIGLDLIGSIYNGPPASVYPGLAAVDAMNGNAKLTFYAGKLTASQIKFVNLSPTNALTRAPTNDTTFTATIVPASGLLKGTFNHTDTTKPAWQGVLFPKAGANQGGYGYFMTASPKVIDGTGESGAVHFESK